jgi:hypothetical protein
MGSGVMKRTPMKASQKPLARSKPMERGESRLAPKKPMARGSVALARNSKPMRARSKTNSNPRKDPGTAALVRGQPCYLLLPGILRHDPATVVPCHSNQSIHGKGMGIKAHDEFTVPGCDACHRELDQGSRFTRDEKFGFWNRAYAAWAPEREKLLRKTKQNI